MIAVADTGFVYALAISSQRWHAACLQLHRRMTTIYLPQSVLTESIYMLTRAGGNRTAAAFLMGLSTSKYILEALTPEDIRRVAELLEKYADTRVDFVDASVAAVAERLTLTHILTIDRRDFNIIRPLHADFFTLLPEEA